MGFVDFGNQIKTFTFKQEATSPGFNKNNVGVIKPGIYQGGKVFLRSNLSDPTVNPQWIIKPLTIAFESRDVQGREILVNVITTSDITLSAYIGGVFRPFNNSDEDWLITARFDWLNVINNFADFVIKPRSALLDRDLIIARLVGQGINTNAPGTAPLVSYDMTSYGDGYDGLDERDLVSTNLGNIGNNRLIRWHGEYFRLRLSTTDPNDGNIPPSSEIAFPITSGKLELIDTQSANDTIEVFFTADDFNLKAVNGDKKANSSFFIKYPSGYKINTEPPMKNNCLNIFQDELNRLRVRNSTGEEKIFLCKLKSNNYREVF